MKKHIAQSGQQAGKWVNCTAKGECRIGGTHVTDTDLFNARVHYELHGGERVNSLPALPIEAVLSYTMAPKAEKDEAKAELADRNQKIKERAAKRTSVTVNDAFVEWGTNSVMNLKAEEDASLVNKTEINFSKVYDLASDLSDSTPLAGETDKPTQKDIENIGKLIRSLNLDEDETSCFSITAYLFVRYSRGAKAGITGGISQTQFMDGKVSINNFYQFMRAAKNSDKVGMDFAINSMYLHFRQDVEKINKQNAWDEEQKAQREAKKAQRADRTKKVLAFFGKA